MYRTIIVKVSLSKVKDIGDPNSFNLDYEKLFGEPLTTAPTVQVTKNDDTELILTITAKPKDKAKTKNTDSNKEEEVK
ncbi:MAG: hypothetical protein ACRBFS_19350 [Aureispira sp.]